MKKVLLVISILLIGTSCSQTTQNNNGNNTTKKQKAMKTKYMLNYSIPYPTEILINDMVAEIDLNQAPYPPCNLNEFLIPGDTQNIKIKIFSPNKQIDAITNNLINKINNELAIYKYTYEGEDIKDMNIIQKISFSETNKPMPYIEGNWKIDLKDKDSYCNLNDYVDLKNIDKEKLLKNVLAKFIELRDMLNKGDVPSFMKEISHSNNIYFKSNGFNNEEEKEFENNQSDTYLKQKNTIQSIENYKLRILGNGKLVSLERNNTPHQGQGVLLGLDKVNKKIYTNYIMLGIPKNTTEFKIFKINSYEEAFE